MPGFACRGSKTAPVSCCQMTAARVAKRTAGLMRPASSNTASPSRMKRKPPPRNGSPFLPTPQATALLMPPCSPISMPIQRRPILCATAAVVPEPRKEPRKESRTRSFSCVAIWGMRCKRRSGLGVPKRFWLNRLRISFFASSLCPSSSNVQIVVAGMESVTSLRKRL